MQSVYFGALRISPRATTPPQSVPTIILAVQGCASQLNHDSLNKAITEARNKDMVRIEQKAINKEMEARSKIEDMYKELLRHLISIDQKNPTLSELIDSLEITRDIPSNGEPTLTIKSSPDIEDSLFARLCEGDYLKDNNLTIEKILNNC